MGFDAWLTMAQALGSAASYLTGLRSSQRKKIATYLQGIADSLSAMAQKASERQSFAEECGAIQIHARQLKDICSGVVQTHDLDLLAQNLDRAATSPASLNAVIIFDRASTVDRERHIRTIREAAGSFRALAQIVAVT